MSWLAGARFFLAASDPCTRRGRLPCHRPEPEGLWQLIRASRVTDYDVSHLADDLTALLDHYGYDNATFIGHDWGASVVWWLTLLHPDRVKRVINLALPYQERGAVPWIEMMEQFLGPDYYMVHFNRQPGVADAILEENTERFLGNLFRKNVPPAPPVPGMMLNLATSESPLGDPMMTDAELGVYVSAFKTSGFTGRINWYRNLDRNWHLLADVDPIIHQPTLMIYGDRDMIPKFDRLSDYVPNVEVVSLDCGHNIQQEKPEETTQAILSWLRQQDVLTTSEAS